MSEVEEVKQRQRRSRQEIGRLVAEFESSGLRPREFCRIHGMTHGTLKRGRERLKAGSETKISGLVAVELSDAEAAVDQNARCGLEVILAKGRRIELARDFDAKELRRVVEVLEGF